MTQAYRKLEKKYISSSNVEKKKIWDQIASEVSSAGVTLRTGSECKNKWANSHRIAKNENVSYKKTGKGTGGGRPPVCPCQISKLIIESAPGSKAKFEGIAGGVATPLGFCSILNPIQF